ncbi:PREDICTED: uncharacterized protein LOC109240278 [Nicotiana attenuata]|uniref:uncharacterized protein LOC109240278 n=1 Tax=Nicotiana attenuata TaxID=49451 RepID=UPI000905A872|nr:PREDICTED: uncharacterized protein LOC109240278 [Nicotiana attenuata]
MVVGELSEPFNVARGLRQGDPISPFLFAIAMEYLSRQLNELKEDRLYQFHPKCAKLGITHLSFADDLLLFAKGNLSSINALYKCFRQFSEASGLQANLVKRKNSISQICAVWNSSILGSVIPYSCKGSENCRCLLQKLCMDKLWIRWIHAYYDKGKPLMETSIPAQASWITRKILEAKKQLHLIPATKTTRSLKHSIYHQVLPEMRPATWKCLMFKNDSRLKEIFIMWLQLQGRLATTDRLVRWGLTMDTTCTLCQTQLETREHLFVECEFAKAIWMKM